MISRIIHLHTELALILLQKWEDKCFRKKNTLPTADELVNPSYGDTINPSFLAIAGIWLTCYRNAPGNGAGEGGIICRLCNSIQITRLYAPELWKNASFGLICLTNYSWRKR